MTIPTRECMKTEKPCDELEKPNMEEEITKRKVAKFLFGIFILLSLIHSATSMLQVCADVINWTTASTRSVIAAVFIVLIITLFLTYCYFRKAYTSLWKAAGDEIVPMFSPCSSWNEDGTWLFPLLAIFLQFCAISFIFQWCWMDLLFGADIATNYFKTQDNVEGLAEKAIWNQTRAVTRGIRMDCLGYGQFLLIILVTTIINGYCHIYEKRKNRDNEKPSKFAFLWRKAYGQTELGLSFQVTYFFLFLDHAEAFLALSGWVTEEYVQSLSWFSSLFFVAIPVYLVFFVLSCVMELMICAMEHCRKEEERELALAEDLYAISSSKSV